MNINIINRYGFDHEHPDQVRPKRVNQARRWIRKFMKPRKTLNRTRSAYGLKHAIERLDDGAYIGEGEVIMGMILEGYSFEHKKKKTYFYASYRKLNHEERIRNGLRPRKS